MHLRIRPIGIALAALSMNLVAGGALADSSCDGLFTRLRQEGARVMNGQKQLINVLWTTNYSVPQADARFAGIARGQMGLQSNMQQMHGDLYRVETYYDFRLNSRPEKKRGWVRIFIFRPTTRCCFPWERAQRFKTLARSIRFARPTSLLLSIRATASKCFHSWVRARRSPTMCSSRISARARD